MPLLRRRRLPAPERALLDLRPGDKVLVEAHLTDGRWAVATRRAVHLLEEGQVVRVPWSDVDRGSLDPTTRVLTVTWVWGGTSRLPFAQDGASVAFTQTFRERVQQSVVHAVPVTVPGGARVRLALRRDEEGEIFTQVLGDGTVDVEDPAVSAALDVAEAEARDAAGLPR
ncbi:hypothetical protein [Cellulomonas fimi]|uniref:Uncharacterized protein n=1 Tax=Cellulomonas fimi (strain ATCC 484 / DSM 20113 / JCM 1341 / CCUG 24087 / LMG 16345 / NBRC 15513 / NCIMB 8980 / NCTC 7547 / NRS-133) TaxID=590998 RepID=F4H2Q5_CELFA|nr:hypothetical protein [Cellulomonas fimi]AEE46404.1 hypothetical protein Celf_2277 [Cellulomonas fimi ATCC 484]NNH08695.1 hypothetical protein [Cellulomonas fimi]VEH32859.1 Uncharacterised protein [Cellulomonas fimi]